MGYQIEIFDPSLTFNAAHFLSFPIGDGQWRAERLHSHDFRFSATLEGELDACDCVLDFVAATEAARAVLKRLNYAIFVATRNPCVDFADFNENEKVLTIREVSPAKTSSESTERLVVGPLSDFVFIEATNASTEALASFVLKEWANELEKTYGVKTDSLISVRVRLEESPGCAVVVSYP